MPPFPCRSCHAPVTELFVDLGETPLANSYLPSADSPESQVPLRAFVCGTCFLVQLDHDVPAESIFTDYAYFTSYSDGAVAHARTFCEEATRRFGLSAASRVVEVASNDGYLLRHFVAAGIPVLGVEPAANVAEVAAEAGVPTKVAFFNRDTARDLAAAGFSADLVAANNVMAHVPDLAYFVAGFTEILKPEGVVSVEFPHLVRLIEGVQFDTIYHEHYSYLSLLSVEKAFTAAGLRVFDVEQLSTHGGSLRVFGCKNAASHAEAPGLAAVRAMEKAAGLHDLAAYREFGPKVEACRRSFLDFLASAKLAGKSVAAYGAAAKGNTLLNYCGVTSSEIAYVVDRNPRKQNRFMPGSRLPILAPETIERTRPDYLVILPWNIREEIMGQMSALRGWGGQFVTAIPQTRIWP